MAHTPDEENRIEVDASSLEDFRNRRQELTERRTRLQTLHFVMSSLVALVLVLTAISYLLVPRSSPTPSRLLALPIIAIFLLLLWKIFRAQLRDADADIQELDFQIDLQRFKVSTGESRAEKILRINDFQLRRYYDLNLSQNFWVFSLGILCILLGVGVIASTLYLVLHVAATLQAQVVTAILGGTGALFTNIIAAIYLKMNTSASDNLAAFHGKLVETNRLLLANVLASRIEDPEKRGSTLADLAIGLTTASSKTTGK